MIVEHITKDCTSTNGRWTAHSFSDKLHSSEAIVFCIGLEPDHLQCNLTNFKTPQLKLSLWFMCKPYRLLAFYLSSKAHLFLYCLQVQHRYTHLPAAHFCTWGQFFRMKNAVLCHPSVSDIGQWSQLSAGAILTVLTWALSLLKINNKMCINHVSWAVPLIAQNSDLNIF